MNRRQFKKACKKAAARLQAEFPGEFEIVSAEGDETLYAPRGYEPPRGEFRRFATPLRGTALVWERTSYETDEWDCRSALEIYESRRAAEDFDWERALVAPPLAA